MKQAPLNSNQYNTNLENTGTRDYTANQRQDTFEDNKYQPPNYNENSSDDVGCCGKLKNIYTNPDTPCMNYFMIFLTLLCIIVIGVVFYSVFFKG